MGLNVFFSQGDTILDTHRKRRKRFYPKRRHAKYLEKKEKEKDPTKSEQKAEADEWTPDG